VAHEELPQPAGEPSIDISWPAAKLVERDGAFVLEMALAGFEPAEIAVMATPR
jgi:HSP20 family molecular chaperone IbpA